MPKKVLILFPGSTHPVKMGSQVRTNYLIEYLCTQMNCSVDLFTPYGMLRPERWGQNWTLLDNIYIPKAVAPPKEEPLRLQMTHLRAALNGSVLEALWRDLRDNIKRMRSHFKAKPPVKPYEILAYHNASGAKLAQSAASPAKPAISPVSARLKEHNKPHYREALRELLQKNQYDVVIVTYVWMSEMVDWLLNQENRPMMVCDTVDVQYMRESRLHQFREAGEFDFASEKTLELAWLAKYDLVLGITSSDARELGAALPNTRVCSLPIEIAVPEEAMLDESRWEARLQGHQYDLVFLGGQNEGNLYAIEHLLEVLLPKLLERRPEATLAIAGAICDTPVVKRHADNSNVTVCGYVNSVSEFMTRGRLLLAPIHAGGGVKVKVLDGLAHGLPVITTPVGIEGIPFEDGVQGFISEDDDTLIDRALQLLDDPQSLKAFSLAAQQGILRNFSKESVYRDFNEAVSQ